MSAYGTGWVHADVITAEISERGLYLRGKDGEPAKVAQIRSRAGKYPDLFERSSDGSGTIRLRR